jgi:hypothetical protein
MRKFFVLLYLSLMTSLNASADEYADEVRDILELSNTTETTVRSMNDVLNQLAPEIIIQLHEGFTAQGKDVTRADVTELVATYKRKVIEEFTSEIVPATVEEYRKYFTLEDLRELKTIFQTPIFQKHASKQPDIQSSLQKTGERLGQEIGAQVMQDLISADPRFR